MAEFADRIELLRRVRLFSNLAVDDLEAVNELLVEKRFRKGSVIFEQGDDGDALYIVESGRAKVAIKDEEGREKILSVFGEGDYFGEMALLSDQPRSATVTVVGDTELLMLPKEVFEKFLAANLNVMRQFVSLMSRRLAETSALTTRNDEESEQKAVLGKCIAMFSPKGGTGKTTVAVNLAVAIREQTNKSVCIMDASYPFADVGVMMNLEPRRTIVDLLPHINELGGEIMESILQPHASGVKVLLAPPTPEETELVTAEHVSIVISALRELYEFVIVDTHGSFTDISIGVLDAADLILVMTTLELPSLKNVRQFVDTATQKLGYPLEKMAIIANRASAVGGLTITDVENSVGAKVVSVISSGGPVAVTAANQGVPFVISHKESQLYRDMLSLVKLLVPQNMLEADEEEYSVFNDDAEAVTLVDRFRAAPRRVLAGAREGIRTLKVADLLIGLGTSFLVGAPFMIVFALLGFIAQAMSATLPAFPVLNLPVWAGAFGGAFLSTRMQEPRRGAWVVGAILGASYGLVISSASLGIGYAVGASVKTPFFLVLLYIIPYGLLGIAGAMAADYLRPKAQALLG